MATAAAAAKSLQSCPTVCDPIDSSPPGSPVPGILQAKTQEWVAISFSNVWKWKVKVKSLSHVRLLADSYFPMDERDSFIFLVKVGMRFTWSPTHLVTQVSSRRSIWSSTPHIYWIFGFVTAIHRVHRARRFWNFSNSLVTRAWAWARDAWKCSMHWCTCYMDSWLSLQQPALHQNMRPSIFWIFSLCRHFTMESTASCTQGCGSSTMATRAVPGCTSTHMDSRAQARPSYM